MQMTLGEIAGYLGCELIGDKDVVITALASVESAKAGELTFAAESKYIHRINNSDASAFIVHEDMSKELKDKNLIISKNSYYSFTRLLVLFHKKEKKIFGINENAFVSDSAAIAESAAIYPNVYIDDGVVIGDDVVIYPGCFVGENVTIGRGVTIYPNVVIREESVIGSDVIIHSGVIIGGDGFGYVLNEGKQFKIPQVGKVVIEDNVEIGANTTIDRAALGETVIGEGTKIDNLVMIAHNVKIGRNCVIVSQGGISGSSKLGDCVTMGGQSGMVGHIKIGDGVTVAARAVVTHDIGDGETVGGFPAIELGKWKKAAVLSNRLPDMKKKLTELEKRIAELERGA
jgi:UDP-3-O-[3-hydroxymyristoyl] glucosamine N-acyltransferase